MSFKITVENLRQVYRVPVREAGLGAAVRSLLRPKYSEIEAVAGINFTIGEGEIVGFLGPNGAGKTTTLKVLSGLLYPTAGQVDVAGFSPWQRKKEFLSSISLVMGNKAQLTWENTVLDSFIILKEIYRVGEREFKDRLDELESLLELGELLPKLARNLSLGERARCEFAAALLHRPRILFLDEPSLGLDISVQVKLREFIREYNRKHGTTILLTSHYMADITALCDRVLLIHTGKLIYDGALARLVEKMAPFKLLKISSDESRKPLDAAVLTGLENEGAILQRDRHRMVIRVKKADAGQLVAHVARRYTDVDLTVEDAPIDEVIDRVYREGVAL